MSFYVKMATEKMQPVNIIYMRRVGAYGTENYALMEKFKDFIKSQNLFNSDCVILGMPLDNPQSTTPEKCRYDVCMINQNNLSFPSDKIQSRQFDGGKYLVYLIDHTSEAMQKAWSECIPNTIENGYTPDTTRPITERYAKKLVDSHLCELCVPIV